MGDDMYDFDNNADQKPRLSAGIKQKKASKGSSSHSRSSRDPSADGYGGHGSERAAGGKERVVRDTVQGATAKKASPERVRAQVMRSAPAPAADDDDGYGDDDFEDYGDDDFEDDEPAPAPAPEPSWERQSKSSRRSGTKAPPAAGEGHSGAAQAPSQEKPSSRPDGTSRSKGIGSSGSSSGNRSSSAPRAKKFGSVSMSLDAAAMGGGARTKRLQRLYASGVLEMQEEKFTILAIPSSTPADYYQRRLRGNPAEGAVATIRQMGVPGDDERRSVEVSTDDRVQVDQEVQFCYGDDTALLSIFDALTKKRQAAERGIRLTEAETAAVAAALAGKATGSTSKSTGTGMDDNDAEEQAQSSGSHSRLGPFLQRSALVCERLIEENEALRHGSKHIDRSSMHNSLFDEQSDWASLGSGPSGASEIIRSRPVVSAQFSALQPNLLVTTHPYLDADEEDLLPYKGVFCVWDVSSPADPTYILCSSGQPTSCAFSCTQTFLLMGGTSEGTLNLWDLRESSSIHRDRDAVDLGIERGIRKPCYSSPLSMQGVPIGSNSNGKENENEMNKQGKAGTAVALKSDEQHAAPISQVISIGDPETAAVSQFASLDQRAMICLWVSSNSAGLGEGSFGSDSTGSNGNSAGTGTGGNSSASGGLSPWGRVSLMLTRTLHVHPGVSSPSAGLGSRASFFDSAFSVSDAIGQVGAPSVLAAVPGDSSMLLAANTRGAVSKVARFGEPPAPAVLERNPANSLNIAFQSKSDTNNQAGSGAGVVDVLLYSEVTCIAVQRKLHFDMSDVTASVADMDDNGDRTQLVLVGRTDGSVDLFRMDLSAPVQTWIFDGRTGGSRGGGGGSSHNNSNNSVKGPAIASVRWMPNKMTSFMVTDARGGSYMFDLLLDSDVPVCSEALDPHSVVGNMQTDVSRCRPGSTKCYLSKFEPWSVDSVQVRPLWEGWLRSNSGNPTQEGQRLMQKMPEWALRTTHEKGRLHLVDPLAGSPSNSPHK